ncbi:MAG: hypothetical protein F6K65_10510 [Moorea sp. SIO3C2]|nr:hypothetical protein [Moorena sp. SIO3C2]
MAIGLSFRAYAISPSGYATRTRCIDTAAPDPAFPLILEPQVLVSRHPVADNLVCKLAHSYQAHSYQAHSYLFVAVLMIND